MGCCVSTDWYSLSTMLPPSKAKTTGFVGCWKQELVAPRPVDWFLQLKTINQSRFFFPQILRLLQLKNSADFNGQRPSQMNSCVGRMQRDNKRGEISLEFSRNGRVDQLNETREFNQPRDELLVVLRSTPRDNKFFFVVAAEGEKTWPQTCAKVYSCCWRKGNNKQQQPQQQQPSNKMASARRSLFPSTAV